MFAKVFLLGPPFSELVYTLPAYFPSDFWKTGIRVAVPVGGKKKTSLRAAFIASLTEKSDLPESVKYKNIFFPLETSPLLSPELAELSKALAARHGFAPGCAYAHLLPARLRSTNIRIRWRAHCVRPDQTLHSLSGKDDTLLSSIATDLLAGNAYFISACQDEAEREICSLNTDPPWSVRPAAKKQRAILEYLHDHGAQSRRRLLSTLGADSQKALVKLVSRGLVSVSLDDAEEDQPCAVAHGMEILTLTEEQDNARLELLKALKSDRAECRLLYGVTGSGKTAVYMELARQTLAAGRSVFLLAPEVALAHKLRNDAQSALPNADIFLYHGYQTAGRREKTFRELAARDKACVVVGSRSALFLPAPRAGCIILDEEHDDSFKQDESFPYHAKEVAWFRASWTKGLMLLGSATPDLRSFQASTDGSLAQLRLLRRVSGRDMPPMQLVDIGPGAGMSTAGSINSQSASILARECEEELLSCLDRGEQAVILLNRRGYAPHIFCVDCNHTLRCPHCEIGLAYHKTLGKLLCHYCGYSLPYPSPCPDCGKSNFLPVGEGTEKLEERLEILARQPILRLDRDNARREGKMEEILSSFAQQKSPFLVGTQMLSKGHHFPNVTLVLVADGDVGLNMPDYRAAERTFQLLVQAAGRAGRGQKQGKVLVQTRNRNHYCWEYILNYDYEGFARAELAKRQRHLYPPYTHLAMLRINFPLDSPEAQAALEELGRDLRQKARAAGLIMLGPAPAPLAILRGQKRYQCLFKGKEWNSIREMYFYAQKHRSARHLRLFLDLDPVNMM